jgi:hypothetical protein
MVIRPVPRPLSGFFQEDMAGRWIETEKLALGSGVQIAILESHVDEVATLQG